ncbi:MAG: glycosyltransferase family 4 protein [Chthoniobacteraceae bacterium]
MNFPPLPEHRTLLAVSVDYPPFHRGGYELGSQRVLESLAGLGWQITVLTNEVPDGKTLPPGDAGRVRVWRRLDGDTHGRGRFGRELHNTRVLRAALDELRPAAVYFWKHELLGTRLPSIAQQAGYRVLHYLSDATIPRLDRTHANSRLRAKFTRLGLSGLWPVVGLPAMRMILLDRYYDAPAELHFCSEALRADAHANGIRGQREAVIPWGVELAQFPMPAAPQDARRLLYVGRLAPEKGIETAIRAVQLLRSKAEGAGASLTIVGGGEPAYELELRGLVEKSGLAGSVQFAGFASSAEVGAAYRTHGTLLFPSRWEEPFAITPLEAMASGVVVVATATGGSREIFVDGENALIFPVDDGAACADAAARLCTDANLRERLRRAGRSVVEQRYTLEQMARTIAAHLAQP